MLLATGVEHNNLIIKLSAQNPFPVRDQDGEVVSTTKLSVGDTPISYSNDEMEKCLFARNASKITQQSINNPRYKE